jgi:uncharacterized BrkB/YihY/UPF0761 family membrane protein
MEFTLDFIQLFFWVIYLIFPLLLFLCLIIVMLGQLVGRIERWHHFDALYWSFITATTVGYGDFYPLKKISRILSVLIAFVGVMFTGIVIAVTLNAATIAFEKHVDKRAIEKIKGEFD